MTRVIAVLVAILTAVEIAKFAYSIHRDTRTDAHRDHLASVAERERRIVLQRLAWDTATRSLPTEADSWMSNQLRASIIRIPTVTVPAYSNSFFRWITDHELEIISTVELANRTTSVVATWTVKYDLLDHNEWGQNAIEFAIAPKNTPQPRYQRSLRLE